jgi:hypothetical protein
MKAQVGFALVLAAAAAVLGGCSGSPSSETKQAATPPPAPEPKTGREAFYQMFVSARTWSPDATPLEMRSMNLNGVKSGAGTAGAWRVTFVSEAHARMKTYTWSAIEGEGLHQGVFGELDETWPGPTADLKPFLVAALKFDSDAAWQTAAAKSAEYMQKHPNTPILYLLSFSNRFPDTAWRVVWGESVSASTYSVFVDATTGKFLEKVTD